MSAALASVLVCGACFGDCGREPARKALRTYPPLAACEESACFAGSKLAGEWDCDVDGGTRVSVERGRLEFTNGIGRSGAGCVSCDGAFEAVSSHGDFMLVRGRLGAAGETATIAWQWCTDDPATCRSRVEHRVGPAVCRRVLPAPALPGVARCADTPCSGPSSVDGAFRCAINRDTRVEVAAGKFVITNGLGQRGTGCITCDGAFEAVSDRGEWAATSGRLLVDGDRATLQWQWCMTDLETCRTGRRKSAGPVACVREAPTP